MKDESIIQLYFERNESAIDETDKKYGNYCYRIADNILHSREDSEECVNDTWLRAWDAIPPARPDCLRLFLAKITRNLSFNRWRAGRAEKRGGGETALVLDELEECLSGMGDVEEQFQAAELSAAINDFVKALPERDGNIFVRRYFFGEPLPHIAKRYGLAESSVRVALHRARRRLKERLEKDGFL